MFFVGLFTHLWEKKDIESVLCGIISIFVWISLKHQKVLKLHYGTFLEWNCVVGLDLYHLLPCLSSTSHTCLIYFPTCLPAASPGLSRYSISIKENVADQFKSLQITHHRDSGWAQFDSWFFEYGEQYFLHLFTCLCVFVILIEKTVSGSCCWMWTYCDNNSSTYFETELGRISHVSWQWDCEQQRLRSIFAPPFVSPWDPRHQAKGSRSRSGATFGKARGHPITIV